MTQLRLYFISSDLTEFKWYRLNQQTVLDNGHGQDHELKSLAKGCDEVIFVLPAHWVYVTQVEVKSRQQKQLLNAVAFQLEDQLAEDIDHLHFAQGVELDGHVSFTVVARSKMQQILDFEQKTGVKAQAIISEYDVLQHQLKEELSVWESQQHCVISQGNIRQAISCDESQVDFYVQQFFKQPQESVIQPKAAEAWQAVQLNLKQLTNLKQKDYSQGHAVQHIVQQVKIPAVILILIAIAFVVSFTLHNQQLSQTLEMLKSKQTQLLKPKLTTQQIGANPKKALIKALQAQSTQKQAQGFTSIFYQFIKLKQSVPSVELEKLDYRKQQLVVDLQAKSLQDLDQLAELLKSSFKVKVDQMNSTALTSQGRFILELQP